MSETAKLLLAVFVWLVSCSGVHFWHENKRNLALAEKDKFYGKQIETVLAERDKAKSAAWVAQQKLKGERDAIAASNTEVDAWVNAPVPDVVADRLQNAARANGAGKRTEYGRK